MGGFIRNITGVSDQQDAARDASRIQQQATNQSLETMERLNQPFLEFGASAIPQAQPFIDDPTGLSFLQGNPVFGAAVDNANEATMALAAANGKAGSGGTIDQLFKNYLSIGDTLTNSAYNRTMQPVSLGQNSASFQGSSIANLLTNNANAQGAAVIQGGNAQSNLFNNALQTGATAAMFFSDERIKEDMTLLGQDEDGMNVYSFKYSNPLFVGYSAQEVAEKDPENAAVDPVSGLFMVSEKYKPERVA